MKHLAMNQRRDVFDMPFSRMSGHVETHDSIIGDSNAICEVHNTKHTRYFKHELCQTDNRRLFFNAPASYERTYIYMCSECLPKCYFCNVGTLGEHLISYNHSDYNVKCCKKCAEEKDPSTNEIKYKWNGYNNKWKISQIAVDCEQCSQNVLRPKYKSPYLDDKQYCQSILCMQCDPSTEQCKYIWYPDGVCWKIDTVGITCHTCCKIYYFKYYESNSIMSNNKIWHCIFCNPSDGKIKYKWIKNMNYWLEDKNLGNV
jgi:hypothetical protein